MTLQCLPFDHVDPQVPGQVPFSENPTGDLQDQRMDEISALSMQAMFSRERPPGLRES
jgi:hypothetical protein